MKPAENYIIGIVETAAGPVQQVSRQLTRRDRWEHLLVRLGISRMKYTVRPRLYAAGQPTPDSPVMVTANYKLTFDILRKELHDRDAWILVLDTRGINVWCAAGKGTFGTGGLVRRVKQTQLEKIVNHKKLILPQLGATGVAAHQVTKSSGFSVQYGPVRAEDLPEYLANNQKTTPRMRQVRFSLKDRLTLIPIEVVFGFSKLLLLLLLFLFLSGLKSGGYSVKGILSVGLFSTINLFLAFISGTVLAPLLLPWLPARSFSIKGVFSGLLVFIPAYFMQLTGSHFIEHLSWLLLILALSSFATLNFTGSSTFTSLSGVKKEMKIAIPIQISGALVGLVLWLASRFI